ncbi:MAG: GDP-mannose 4,6-dehydratase [Candidatus Paceibacteria bacterium]
MLLKKLGKDESFIDYVKDRPGHDRRYALDSCKLRKLGWSPEVDFEQGIKQTVDWYKKNEQWWKRIKSGEYLEYYKKQYA